MSPTEPTEAEQAENELAHRVDLYKFYMDCYVKGIAFYLGITAFLIKFAIDTPQHRIVFYVGGVACALAILVPLLYSIRHREEMQSDFQRLAALTKTKEISTAPLHMLNSAVLAFWLIIVIGWVCIILFLPPHGRTAQGGQTCQATCAIRG